MDFDRFHDATLADWRPCATPRREPDFVSASRSVYWDEGDAVLRASDHWGRARSCLWLLDGFRPSGPILTGRCRYADFRPFVPLTIERERAVVVAPGSRPPLRGRIVSVLVTEAMLAATARRPIRRAGRCRVDRRGRRGRRHALAAVPGGTDAALVRTALVRTTLEVVHETDHVLVTRCGRRLPRRSLGAAWFVADRAAADVPRRD